MKHSTLLRTLFVALTASLSTLWGGAFAETWSYTFAEAELGKGTKAPDAFNKTYKLNTVDWDCAVTVHPLSTNTTVNFQGGTPYNIGSVNYAAGTFSMSTSAIAGTITAIKISATNGSATSTLSVKIGDAQFDVVKQLTNDATNLNEYTFTGEASGKIEIVLTNDTKKAFKLGSIEVTYLANPNELPAPVISPESGEYTEAQTVTITAGEGIVYYTDNEENPTAESTKYENAIVLDQNGTYTIKAIAISEDGTKSSAITEATYTIDIPTPGEATYTYNFVTEPKFPVTDAVSAAELSATYTLNDVVWTLAATAKDGKTEIYSKNDQTAKGWHFGSGSSPAASLAFSTSHFTDRVEKITINACGGNATGQTISVTVGGEPFGEQATLTTSNADYVFTGSAKGEIVITFSNTEDKAIYPMSFEIQTSAAPDAPVFDIEGGDFNKDITVKITNPAEEGVTYRYTTDGSEPTATTGETYNAETGIAITKADNLEAPVVLKAIAVKAGETTLTSAVTEATYKFLDYNDVYMVGTMNEWSSTPDYLLSYNQENKQYSITATLPAGNYEFKLRVGNDWNNGEWGFGQIDGSKSTWGYDEGTGDEGNKNNNIKIALPVEAEISIVLRSVEGKMELNTNLLKFDAAVAYDVVRVAGESALCGSSWNQNDAANNLTLDPETGKYSLTRKCCHIKTTDKLEYKYILASSTNEAIEWQGDPNSSIDAVAADGLYDVTFTFEKYNMTATLTPVEGITIVEDIAAMVAATPAIGNKYYFAAPITVTHVDGKNIYITDGTTAYLVYDSKGEFATLKANDEIHGFVASYAEYNNAGQLTPLRYSHIEAGTATPDVVELADITEADVNRYVRLNNVQFTNDVDDFTSKKNQTLKKGEATLGTYNQYGIEGQFSASDRYDVIGIIALYSDKVQIRPTQVVARPVVTLATADEGITVTDNTINLGTVKYDTQKDKHLIVNLTATANKAIDEALNIAVAAEAFKALITGTTTIATQDGALTGELKMDLHLTGAFGETTGTTFTLVGAESGEIYYEGQLEWEGTDGTSVDNIEIEGIDIITERNAIVINADHYTAAAIFNAAGMLVNKADISAGYNTIGIQPGVYFLVIDGVATKAVVR